MKREPKINAPHTSRLDDTRIALIKGAAKRHALLSWGDGVASECFDEIRDGGAPFRRWSR